MDDVCYNLPPELANTNNPGPKGSNSPTSKAGSADNKRAGSKSSGGKSGVIANRGAAKRGSGTEDPNKSSSVQVTIDGLGTFDIEMFPDAFSITSHAEGNTVEISNIGMIMIQWISIHLFIQFIYSLLH